MSLSLGRKSLTFTTLGARFILVTLAVGVAAVNSGSNLLYLIVAMMLSLMLLSGILSDLVLWSLRVERRVPREIYAGSPFTLRYRLKNRNKLTPSYALAVSQKDGEGARTAGGFFLRLGPGEERDSTALQTVDRRGRWTTSGYEIATKYPFGLFRKAMLIKKEESCTVYPRIRPLPAGLSDTLSRSLQGEVPSRRKGRGHDLRSLREYAFPEDARGIHWKASARAGRLLLKEYEAQERQAVAVVIDNLQPSFADPGYAARFEESVSVAASFIRHIIFDLERPAFLVTRCGAGRQGFNREDYILLMEELAGLMPIPSDLHPSDISEIFLDWPSVLILPDGGCGWSAFSSGAGVTCEATDGI